MKFLPYIVITFTSLVLGSCVSKRQTGLDMASHLLERVYQEHGGDLYETAEFTFIFREKSYYFKNNGESYKYMVEYEKNGKSVEDIMTNNTFTRTVNGQIMTLDEKQINNARNNLNSVIYFATLPHKLKDPAVRISYQGKTTIEGKAYDLLGVTFDENGGGDDYDDQYLYWVNSATNRIDYFAYNYSVGKGGVRFRSALNPRRVEGILFQDYINYKAPIGTPLSDLPQLYEQGQLIKLSEIFTENVAARL